MQKTVFLDRDGVINRRIMGGYVTHPDELVLLEGAAVSIARLNLAGFRTVVVTNQRGIFLGLMDAEDLAALHALISRAVAHAGGSLEEFYFCPHDRNTGCSCRKPQPGLLDQAHLYRSVDWANAYLIGDSDSDINAGLKRGVTCIKVQGQGQAPAHHFAEDLPQAVDLILNLDRARQAKPPFPSGSITKNLRPSEDLGRPTRSR